ncbi:unnamed protein product [Spodoptera littoralis]|uniref:YEATS domain-containing protein n=1 Tax=Spodoptera littoralis TaxID=7109 RepID=A0A9P0N320_SPOLI|nr:unnamed protein product [Spodoptera littoralis]CAH1642872.1 unnamed protein product [Spodoptera littoralis]
MEPKQEYHDPDYPDAAVCVKEEPPSLSEDEKVDKIKEIIRREFLNELEIRENEVMLIDQRMSTSRRLLHRLRYALVNSYYKDQKLMLTNGQIQDEIAAQHEPRARADVSTILRDGQRRLHPSVRKLLGKQTVDLEEIFKTRAPRNKSRKDYSAMLQKRNYTISADTTKTLRPDKKSEIEVPPEEPCTSRPKKVPRHLDPKITNVVTLDEVTRNKMKYRYRIVIGNTSKYAPAASAADRSTHKWLLYVRGPAAAPDVSRLLTAVTVRLHHSYAPHHTVTIDKPPYHVSRRGWGEFPAKIELHFALPERNRPATVEHTIKLDRNYTGMQMLGAETLIDVWLYSTPEMLEFEYKEEAPTDNPETVIEPTPIENTEQNTQENNTHTDNWMEFFSKGPSEVDVDEMIIKPVKKETQEKIEEDTEAKEENVPNETEKQWKVDYKVVDDLPNEILNQSALPKKRIVKYIDPNTGKIYYLEMDRALDLSKVQEIVINNKTAKISPIKSNGLKSFRKKKGVSLLKPEVKNMLKNTENLKLQHNFAHIENDHCYLATPRKVDNVASVEIKKEKSLFDNLCANVARLNNVRCGVNYLIRKIPLVTDLARDSDFVKNFPFVVESEEKYWKLDFAKRRNIEWSRAKLINRILSEHITTVEPIWRTKQILAYSRLHGHYPIRSEAMQIKSEADEWSTWNDLETRKMESSIKELYPNPSDINTLSLFEISNFSTRNRNSNSVTEVVSDDEEVDVISCGGRGKGGVVVGDSGGLTVLPVEDDDDRLRFLFVERKCADIGIELRNEDVGNGCSYSAVHAVLLSAMRSFAEELVRGGLAVKLAEDSELATPTVWAGPSSSRASIYGRHVYTGAMQNVRTRMLTAADLAAKRRQLVTL